MRNPWEDMAKESINKWKDMGKNMPQKEWRPKELSKVRVTQALLKMLMDVHSSDICHTTSNKKNFFLKKILLG